MANFKSKYMYFTNTYSSFPKINTKSVHKFRFYI